MMNTNDWSAFHANQRTVTRIQFRDIESTIVGATLDGIKEGVGGGVGTSKSRTMEDHGRGLVQSFVVGSWEAIALEL